MDKVKDARKEEVGFVRKSGLYKKVPIKDCWSATGKAPISVRWLDISKGI